MGLKSVIDKDSFDDEIPDDAVRALYTLKDDQYILTGIDDIVPLSDLNKVRGALEKERNDHRGLKKKTAGLDLDKVRTELDRIPELEALAEGKLDEPKIEKIVESRIRAKTAPLERANAELITKVTDLEGVVSNYKSEATTRSLHSVVTAAAKKSGLRDTAIEDAVSLAERHFQAEEGTGRFIVKNGVKGMTEGLEAEAWLSQLRDTRPHWWGESGGGGGRGAGGQGTGGSINNPWTAASWNMTEQARIYREDPKRAEQFAKAAGTKVGGTKPAKA